MRSRLPGPAKVAPTKKPGPAAKIPDAITPEEAAETTDDLLMLVNALAGRVVGGPDDFRRAAQMEPGEEMLVRRSTNRLFLRNPQLAWVINNAPLLMLAGVLAFWALRLVEMRRYRLAMEVQAAGPRPMPRPQQARPSIIDRASFFQRENRNVPTGGNFEPQEPDRLPLTFEDDPEGEAIRQATAAALRSMGMGNAG